MNESHREPPQGQLSYFADLPQSPEERARLEEHRRQRSKDHKRFWLVMLISIIGPALVALLLLLAVARSGVRH